MKYQCEQHKRLANIYQYEGNYLSCRAALQSVIDYSDAANIVNNQAYVDLVSIQLDLYEAGLSLYDMDAVQEQTIRDIAASEGGTAKYAKIMLAIVFDETYWHAPVLKLDPFNTKSLAFENGKSDNSTEKVFVPVANLYPNPNNGNMKLQYNFNEGRDGNITIFDNIGRKMLEYELDAGKNHLNISSNKLENGVYVYKITSGDEIIIEGRLIIIK